MTCVAKTLIAAWAVAALTATTALAFTHDASSGGEPLLVVRAGDQTRSYDLAALDALGPAQIATTTIWTDGVQRFTGVPLRRLLDDAGIADGQITATAINDFRSRSRWSRSRPMPRAMA